MIPNPTTIFEKLQNDLATVLMARPLFAGKKLPDGSAFTVLTEDEGDPETLFTTMIAHAGLSIVVQAPTGKITVDGQPLPVIFNPLVIAVSVSEAVVFNRSDAGTGIRLFAATNEVLRTLHGFAPPSVQLPLYATAMLKDRDTAPDGGLVASRICVFEISDAVVDLTPTT